MNLKNWSPEMSSAEFAWFEKCPKAVLFEIARQFGLRIANDGESPFDAMKREWGLLHMQGLVPQKPPKNNAV